MCGIIGCQLNRPLTPTDLEALRTMRDAMAYRGPDDSGEYYEAENGFYLGHRRLAIIDLDPRSRQPMQREDCTITFNGEIYNYLEVRRSLESEYRFETGGDTEVILYAWHRWGAAALERFEGMYAFALRDARGLHLVTDPFGEKPLYLYRNADGYYFSSEAQALIKHFNIPFEADESLYAEFVNLGFLRAPQTGYKNLFCLPQGAHYMIAPDMHLREGRHWTPPVSTPRTGKIERLDSKTLSDVRDLLCQSLEKCLRADVPIGLFLSSGVDSSLIAALAKKELGRDLKTYTVAFPDGANESQNASKIAQHLGLNHTIINSTEDESWRQAPQSLVDFYGVPIDNTTVFSIFQMCRVAKPFLTVALSGLGGDEIFYGYNKYENFYQRRHLYQNAGLLLFSFSLLRFLLPLPKFKLGHDILKGSRNRQFLRIKNGAVQNIADSFFPLQDALFESCSGLEFFRYARDFDIAQTMPQNLIPSIDRGSMRAGVEVRAPFLNRKLAEYVAQLDQRTLIGFGKKILLKQILSNYVPLDMLHQAKQGFVFPLSRYFSQHKVETALHEKAFKALMKNKDDANAQRLMLRLLILEHMSHG